MAHHSVYIGRGDWWGRIERAITALEKGLKKCPRVSVAAGAGPAFDCDCDKGLVTCETIIAEVAEIVAVERERCAKLAETCIGSDGGAIRKAIATAIRKGE